MVSEVNQSLFELARLVGAGIVGGLIASYATHRFTHSRERESGREQRRRDFRSFLIGFKSEATDLHYPSTSHFANFYEEKKPSLRQLAATVRDDFPRKRRVTFDGLVNTAASFTGGQACEPDGKKRVIEAFDAVLQFLDGRVT
jgi:hypothetical protein